MFDVRNKPNDAASRATVPYIRKSYNLKCAEGTKHILLPIIFLVHTIGEHCEQLTSDFCGSGGLGIGVGGWGVLCVQYRMIQQQATYPSDESERIKVIGGSHTTITPHTYTLPVPLTPPHLPFRTNNTLHTPPHPLPTPRPPPQTHTLLAGDYM
jgi:hypothetical protein